ncbi:MAG TPA: metallopeptidase family protein [Candidatus Saccharimonadales bacterium]|nr:metallopeptidase family protein [Candidatus Saccharimonadales bacterium]
MDVNPAEFEQYLNEAISGVPEPYRSRLQNVAFIIEEYPSEQQRHQLNLYPNETLFGLYEGLPLPARGGATKLLPDKITIFRQPLLAASSSTQQLRQNIGHTVWHEVAHYFGLDHKRIHELDKKQ